MFDRHNEAIDQIVAISDAILNDSALALDPNGDTYYRVKAGGKWGVTTEDRMGRLRGAVTIRLAGGDLDCADAVAESCTTATVSLREMLASTSAARGADATLGHELASAWVAADVAIGNLLNLIHTTVPDPAKPQATAAEVQAAGVRAVGALAMQHDQVNSQLQKRLEGYRSCANQARNIALCAVLLALRVVSVIALVIARSILTWLAATVPQGDIALFGG